MAQFIQLTHTKNFSLTLNVDHICWFNQYREGEDPMSAVRLSVVKGEKLTQETLYVRETYSEIRNKLSNLGLL